MYPFDLETILTKTRGVAKDVVAPNASRVDEEARWPKEAIRALQDERLAGLVVPQQGGGLGQGLYALARVCEILGRECASSSICFGMHCVGSAVIAAKVTADQRERYLLPISEGNHITTLSLSEPGSGSHFYLPQSKLEAMKAGEYRVTGTKSFVTNGGYADSYVISTVAAEPSAPLDQISCVVVPKEADGLEWGPPWKGLGMRGNSSRNLDLRGVLVPKKDLLGKEGDQIWYVFHVVTPCFLIAMAGTYLGLARSALDEARTHLNSRRYTHSGTSLSQVPVLQHRLGKLWATVESTRRLIYHSATAFDSSESEALPAIFSAKAEAAECAVNVVNEVMTIQGGIGYQDSSRIQRLLRDARASHVMSPTTDILRIWTGRVLLEQPLLGD